LAAHKHAAGSNSTSAEAVWQRLLPVHLLIRKRTGKELTGKGRFQEFGWAVPAVRSINVRKHADRLRREQLVLRLQIFSVIFQADHQLVPTMTTARTITQLLADWSNGNRAAMDELTPLVYRELHTLARTYLNRASGKETLQPTALINEVYLRLIDQSQPIHWNGRSHFFGIAARLMRMVLVDHTRVRYAEKRGGGAANITLEETVALVPGRAPNILEVDESLTRLAQVDARKAEVIELRYFGGMTHEETAGALGLAVATVKRDLRLGQAWLRNHLASRV
jgi:RNA polymerase sigma factor (TIGR02999 family)